MFFLKLLLITMLISDSWIFMYFVLYLSSPSDILFRREANGDPRRTTEEQKNVQFGYIQKRQYGLHAEPP